MESVIAIFAQLGADSSLIYQFVIFITTFIIAKLLFFDHLQKVLEYRTERTVKLEGSADAKFEEVSKLSSEYKDKVQEANKEIKSKIELQKTELIKTEELRYRELEQKVSLEVEASRKKVTEEIEQKKELILNEADGLATKLVEKITRG